MSAPHGRLWLAAAAALAGLAYTVPAHARATSVVVPDLTGKTVGAANAALERAGLRPAGKRLALRSTNDGRLEFAPANDARARVTNQSQPAGTQLARGTVIGVGTERHGQLTVRQWSRIEYERGRVILRGFPSWNCLRDDHITLGPEADGARQITVWGVVKSPQSCKRPKALVLDAGAGWTRATIGVPQLPAKPDPAWTARPRVVPSRAMLMPDRRTVLATYSRGACEGVSSAAATIDGGTVTLRVVVGHDDAADPAVPCAMSLVSDSVLIRLPAPAPDGARFVSATS